MNSWDKMYPVETWECARAKKLLTYKKMKTMYLKGDVNLLAFGRMYIFIFLFNRIEYYPYISVDKRKTAIISSRYNSINYSLMQL
jgi:hypothetical protein